MGYRSCGRPRAARARHRPRLTPIAIAMSLFTFFCVAPAIAQDYPTRGIKLIVPFPPGGSTDFWARFFGAKLAAKWGQPVVVENYVGAGGNLGSERVARAEPDGYTLLATAPGPLVINRYLYSSVNFDPDAFTPVSVVYANVSVLSVHPDLPARNVGDLVAAAKANPGKLNYGSAGVGTTQHLAFELLKLKAGIDASHVPFSGNGPALTALLAGQIDAMFVELGTGLPHYKAGTLRALGVGSAARVAFLPDVPAIVETVPDVVADSWMAIAGPPHMPSAIAEKLSLAFRDMLKEQDTIDTLNRLVTTPIGTTPASMAKTLREDSLRWGEIVRATHATAQ